MGHCRKHVRVLAAFCLLLVAGASGSVETTAKDRDAFAASHISQLAKRLAPGEFVPIEAGLPEGVSRFSELLSGYREDGRGAPPIDTWTDSAQWDSRRKQVFFQGLRKSNRFLTYHAIPNVWEELSLERDNAPPRFERFGHLYGRTALDSKRGHFYRLVGNTLHQYVIDEDRWVGFRESPVGGYISIDWHEELDMLVGVFENKLYGFRGGKWAFLGKTAVHGRHSSAKYNSRRGDMLFIGGNRSRRSVDVLTADGKVRHMKDAPFDFGISADDLAHDPITGNYLVLHRDRVLWEYQPDRDEWRMARDMRSTGTEWPFAHGGIVPVVIEELGVILWSQGQGPLLYRHRSAFTELAPGRKPAPATR